MTSLPVTNRVMFHVKHDSTDYYSTDLCFVHRAMTASARGKKVMKGYGKIGSFITLYNPFNLDTNDRKKCFTEEISRIITLMHMFHVKRDDFFSKGSAVPKMC